LDVSLETPKNWAEFSLDAKAVSDLKARPAHFPADLLTLLWLPAFAIITLVVGAHRLWLVLLLIGFLEAAAGLVLVRSSLTSISGWFALLLGVAALAAGTYFALIPW
jgi:hypothetical protein